MDTSFKRMLGRTMLATLLVAGVARADAPPGRYTSMSSGQKVQDNTTRLQWQVALSSSSYSWDDAKSFCDDLTATFNTDWRLPTAPELESLTDVRVTEPFMDEEAFGTVPVTNFWSSTEHPTDNTKAYAVGTGTGANAGGPMDKTTTLRVRCVRGG